MVGSCISFLIYNNDGGGGGCEMDLFFSSFLNVFVIIIEIRECVVVLGCLTDLLPNWQRCLAGSILCLGQSTKSDFWNPKNFNLKFM